MLFLPPLLLLLASAFSHAGQFVLFDVTLAFTKGDADNSKPSPSPVQCRHMGEIDGWGVDEGMAVGGR